MTRKALDRAHNVRLILARERPTMERAAPVRNNGRARADAHTLSEDLHVLRRHASAWLLEHASPGRQAEEKAARPPRGVRKVKAVRVTQKASEIARVRYKEAALNYAAHPPKVVLVSHESGRIIAEQG